MIEKQAQLQDFLAELHKNAELSEDSDMFEEYLEDDFTVDEEEQPEVLEVLSLPSFKNLKNATDKQEIIELINDIEKTNEIILNSTELKAKSLANKSEHSLNSSVEREELKFIKPTPKLILKPEIVSDKPMATVVFMIDYVCDVCDKRFNSDFTLKRHKHSAHPKTTNIKCCDKEFYLFSDYKKHQDSVHAESFVCLHCQKVLRSKKTLRVHIKTQHSAEDAKKFICTFCSKAFNFKVHLENHERTHTG